MYTYSAKLDRVVDGDTVDLIVDLGFKITTHVRFRLLGIDAPEITGVTKPEGIFTKNALISLLEDSTIKVESTGKDKYGRWLAILYVVNSDGSNLNVNQYLVEQNLASTYEK